MMIRSWLFTKVNQQKYIIAKHNKLSLSIGDYENKIPEAV